MKTLDDFFKPKKMNSYIPFKKPLNEIKNDSTLYHRLSNYPSFS